MYNNVKTVSDTGEQNIHIQRESCISEYVAMSDLHPI